MASGSITSWQIDGETMATVRDFIFLGSKITADGDCSHEIKRCLLLRKQRHHFANKGPSSQSYGFSNSHIWIGELNHKESWALKSWCFWTVLLEKTLESLLDCKEIKPVNLKRNGPWTLIGRIDAEAEAPVLWPPDVKSWLIWKDPDSGEDWRQEEKGMAEDETNGWHHQLDGHEFEQALGTGDGQGSLACCSPWGSLRVGHNWATELNWTERMGHPRWHEW